MAPDADALGRIVRAQRERMHLTQRELASQVGVSRSAISELEAGRIAQPRATVFARLARALGVPAAVLLAAAGYPEADLLREVEADEIAVLGASLARLAGDERDWLRARLLEVRDLLLMRQAASHTDTTPRTARRERTGRGAQRVLR